MSDSSKKILILDDDNFLRGMYVKKFQDAGFEVDSIGSVKEALEKFAAGYETDILLFDIVMPVQTGWDLAKEIKNNNYIPKAKKIILSNQGEEEDVQKVNDFEIDGYIVKALNTPSEVVEKVTEISKK